MRHYCTLFDRNYLARGLALHRSLLRHGGNFMLHVLCLDAATMQALSALALPRVELVSIDALENLDLELRTVRPNRTPAEFYFTCKPVLLAYLLERHPDAERLTYLDSDLYFFSDAATAERDLVGHPVALSPHRFSARNKSGEKFGKFNAGWVSIDSSTEARRFVAWWRGRCLEWCRLVVEETRFGDQKYLDQVPSLFQGAVASHAGINLGPWSLDASEIEVAGGQVTVAGQPLVVFHFHSIRRMLFNLYDCGLFEYGVGLTRDIKERIYRPYLTELADCARQSSAVAAVNHPVVRPMAFARQMIFTARALARHSAIHAAA